MPAKESVAISQEAMVCSPLWSHYSRGTLLEAKSLV
jgi:hypothetical protein